jgi:hypothetical protein
MLPLLLPEWPRKNPKLCRQAKVSTLRADSIDSMQKARTITSALQCTVIDCALPENSLLPFVLEHGRHILARSTLQHGLLHFLLPGVGYIAYAMMNRGPKVLHVFSPVALGDPVCAADNTAALTAAFLRAHPGAMFVQARMFIIPCSHYVHTTKPVPCTYCCILLLELCITLPPCWRAGERSVCICAAARFRYADKFGRGRDAS